MSYKLSYDPLPPSSETSPSPSISQFQVPAYPTATESDNASQQLSSTTHPDSTSTLTRYTTVGPYASEGSSLQSSSIAATNYTTIPSTRATTFVSGTWNPTQEVDGQETSLPPYVWYHDASDGATSYTKLWQSTEAKISSHTASTTSEATSTGGLFTFSPYSSIESAETTSSTPTAIGYGGETGGVLTVSMYGTTPITEPQLLSTTTHEPEYAEESDSSTVLGEGENTTVQPPPPSYPEQSYPAESPTSTTGVASSPAWPTEDASPPAYPWVSESTQTPSTTHNAKTDLPALELEPPATLSSSLESFEVSASTSASIPGITIEPINPDAITMWKTTTVTEAGVTTTVRA
ncbi:hypothetical protein MBLNU230_g0789t1 [Neophaeotheca triangularis]